MSTTADENISCLNPPDLALSLADIEVGRILWLPPKAKAVTSLWEHGESFTEPVISITNPMKIVDVKFYNHPILVLSKPSGASNQIHFLYLTTFKGKTLEKRFSHRSVRYEWGNYLAIQTSQRHPLSIRGGYKTLHLDDGGECAKPGYVYISDVYSMDWRVAGHYWGGKVPMARMLLFSPINMEYIHKYVQRKTNYRTPSPRAFAFPPTATSVALPGPIETTKTLAPNTAMVHRRFDSGVSEMSLPPLVDPPGHVQDMQPPRRQILTAPYAEHDEERQPLISWQGSREIDIHNEADSCLSGLWKHFKLTRLGIIICHVFCWLGTATEAE